MIVDFHGAEIEVSQGNIDMLDTQKQIIDIMKGGREAFDKRKMIYTSWRTYYFDDISECTDVLLLLLLLEDYYTLKFYKFHK